MLGMNILRLLLLLITVCWCGVASGFCIDPRVWPETVAVHREAGNTSLVFGPAVSGGLFNIRVTVNGTQVLVEADVLNACTIITPPQPRTQTISVGFLTPGTYQLRVVYANAPGGRFSVLRTFAVGANAGIGVGVPAIGAGALALLVIGLGLVGVSRLRTQPS